MEKSDFEPIKGCKHPLIVSWATSIGSASRASDEVLKRGRRNAYLFFRKMMNKAILLSLYSKKFDYSHGSTPIRSAGRAPYQDEKC
jgi:hypothetical protein